MLYQFETRVMITTFVLLSAIAFAQTPEKNPDNCRDKSADSKCEETRREIAAYIDAKANYDKETKAGLPHKISKEQLEEVVKLIGGVYDLDLDKLETLNLKAQAEPKSPVDINADTRPKINGSNSAPNEAPKLSNSTPNSSDSK